MSGCLRRGLRSLGKPNKMAEPGAPPLSFPTFIPLPFRPFLLLPLLLIVSAFPSTAKGQAGEGAVLGGGEKQILLQLKAEWGNPPSLSSWTNSSSSHCSGWHGVACSEGGSVIALSLVEQGIEGWVPAATCSLRNLSFLNLFNNSLGGEFPTTLYNCSNLRSLNLSQNLFVGVIPTDVDRLSQLRVLDLSYNSFSGDVPAAIARIPELFWLQLEDNLFNGTLPKELGSMVALEYFSLAYNPLQPTRIPPEFGNLKKLKFLWISQASLVGDIPDTLGNLTELEHLDLSVNNLTGTIPGGIWQLGKLQKLYLYDNQLSGEIGAAELLALNLTEVDLGQNKLTGHIPEDFGKLHSLRRLVLYANELYGGIPHSISRIPALEDIRLFDNSLTGVLPPEMGKHSKLVNFEVSRNRVQGGLPENLCVGGALNSVNVFMNGFTGRLPESLGRCDTLTNLQVYDNRFSGDVPSGIWSLPNLGTVIMHGNALSGQLPETLPPHLLRLEIEGNRFSGKVPSSSRSLLIFRASNNNFTGEIPSNLTGMSQLQELLLDRNEISGEIPAGIGLLRELTYLNLSTNRLSGSIPRAVGYLPSLTSLDLSGNRLTGQIPPEIGQLRLNFLNLSSNSLTGQVPPVLQNHAYDNSFLSNPGVCSSNSLSNLPSCGAKAFAKAGASKNISKGLLALFLALGLLFVFGGLVFIFLVVRDRKRKNNGADDASHWKLTSFQSLDFGESSIIRGITPDNLVGIGGFGQVFRVPVGNSAGTVVAVKKIWNSKMQESKLEREFLAEVRILSSIRHNNIVKLLGYVAGTNSTLLVYHYMENGSLHWWLHGKKDATPGRRPEQQGATLDWPTRLKIAVGAAQGLSYMHHECSQPIIHRDVKSSNILLDSEFRPKVSDFGLARILVMSGEQEVISSVAGSFGYMAPECAYSWKVTEKVDVYGFGVVLLELATGKQANGSDVGQSCLAEWAWRHFQEGIPLVDVLDEQIRDPLYEEEMDAVLRLGLICTGTLPSTRPSMKEVLHVLTGLSQTQRFQRKLSGIEYDVAPLLQGARNKSSRRKRASDTSGDDAVEEEQSSIACCV